MYVLTAMNCVAALTVIAANAQRDVLMASC